MRAKYLVGAALFALAVGLSPAVAGAQQLNVDHSGVAISGYDPVAYFTAQSAVHGSPEITATYEGATYHFSTRANRDAFVANPARYLPVYGGYCAYGVAHGHKVDVDPEAFRVVDNKLYLNYSKDVQKKWLADIPGNIALADSNWAGLRDKPRD
jgi:YHS domain-containing protein